MYVLSICFGIISPSLLLVFLGESKRSLFAVGMTFCLENPKLSIKKKRELITNISKVTRQDKHKITGHFFLTYQHRKTVLINWK